jgi:hypothetical protein
MHSRSALSQILLVVGGLAMLVGAVDLLEGSLLILPGSALLAIAAFLGHADRRERVYRVWVFGLIAVGVGAMFVLSGLGGIGGSSRFSAWWGLLIVPYLVGWSMGIWGPGSPLWMLLLGIAVSIWLLRLAAWLQMRPDPQPPEGGVLVFTLAALGLLTIGGCVYRLTRWRRAVLP